jgi:hypothetical protein
MSYDYHPETGMIVFTDGVKYTLEEFMILAKGRLSDDDAIRAIHQVKKTFDGVIEKGDFECRLPEYDGEVSAQVPVPHM